MKIGLYGGSFDPIHHGHVNVAKYAIENLGLDKLIFIPASKSPFKNKTSYANDEKRIDMINLVKPSKSEVSTFEIKRGGTSYTIDTVKYFKNKYPNAEIFLLIGSDNLSKLHKWKSISEISKMAKIIIFRRDKNISKINIKKFNATLLNNRIWDYSSTNVKNGEFDNIDKRVKKYIGHNHLYMKEISINTLSAKRQKHCVSAADFAVKLAKKNKVDSRKAWTAGYMHDITKEWSYKKHKKFLIERGFDPTNAPELIWHQWTGALWLKDEYMLDDEEISDAIFVHSNADSMDPKKLSKLTKILYIADKLCVGRKYIGIQKHREIAIKNLEKGFEIVSKQSKQFIIEKYGKCVYYPLKRVEE